MDYWVSEVEKPEGYRVAIRDVFFAADPSSTGYGSHIELHKSEVVIQNITMFPGILTYPGAILWGLKGAYRRATWPIRKHTNRGKELLKKAALLRGRKDG